MPRTGVTSLAGIQRRFEPPVALFGFVVRHVVVVGCDGSKRGAVRSTARTVVEGSKRGAARTEVVIRSTVGICMVDDDNTAAIIYSIFNNFCKFAYSTNQYDTLQNYQL